MMLFVKKVYKPYRIQSRQRLCSVRGITVGYCRYRRPRGSVYPAELSFLNNFWCGLYRAVYHRLSIIVLHFP